MKRLIPILILFFSVTLFLAAQTTGSFLLNVDFPQADYQVNRNLYFYVPADYDENQSYKLVVGFRGGPHSNAGQFRDQLTFLSDSLDAIILCPENSHHFNNQEGLVKRLFNYSVDTAMAIYNIDPDFIYLTGLSYGGRHAVIVSMDTDAGPIPAIRGVIPFAAGSNSQLEPNYGAVSEFAPACICIGLNDNANFQNVSLSLHQDIERNNGIALHNEIAGVGHTVVFPTYPQEMMKCVDFIENQYSSVNVSFDLDEIGMSITPNPVEHLLFIHKTKPIVLDKMYITNLNGQIIKNISNTASDVNVSELPVGNYFFTVRVGNQITTQQFSIQRSK